MLATAAAQPAVPPRYKWTALSNTTLGMFMASLDASIVLISLPAIFRGIDLNPLTPGNIGYLLWMLMGYLVVTAVLVVTFGRMGDMFGRVRMYNAGFAVFTGASIALSLTPGTGGPAAMWLIIWRVVQGIGGALLMANSTAILTDAFPAAERGRAMGISMVAGIAGSFIGLIAGGILADINWRLVFWVNVPFGVFGTIWAYAKLRELGVQRRARIDWWGNLTFAAGLIMILIGITYGLQPSGGHSMGWTSPWVLFELIGGVALLIVFGDHRDPGRRADVPPRAVQDPRLRGRQCRIAAVVDRARRHAVHADHLVAGHLAAAARLQLRRHPAVGRHLHASR